jgi:transposase
MAVKQDYIDCLVSIPGFSVGMIGPVEDGFGGRILMIELIRREVVYRCRCGREFTTRYDSSERCIRDLSYGPWKAAYLVFWQARVECPECGVVTEHLDWVEPLKPYTKRLAAAVALSCRELRSLRSVAGQYDLHWGTVKAMDKAAMEAELPASSEANPRLLGVDEFAIRRRHRYGTTVVDLETMEIPYVARDRTKESLAGFYRALGPEKCERIEAVAMDLWPAYEEATRSHCLKAEIVYDPFHLIAAYGRDVVDKVRHEEYERASAEDREVFKGSKYLLLKNRKNLDKAYDEPARLSELLRLNRNLSVVHTLKDDLKQLWRYRSEAWARKWFAGWKRRAMRSGIEALKRFAKKLEDHLDGILAHCRYQIHTGYLEGVNNKIKVIKRVAFGFRDVDYFFLKIRAAFRKPIHTET